MPEMATPKASLGWVGPHDARCVFVGEAWGEQEDMLREPFVGASGQEMWRMLGEAWPEIHPELHVEAARGFTYGAAWVRRRLPWLSLASVAFTNVFNFRPYGNNIDLVCGDKSTALSGRSYLQRGKYVRAEFASELMRLWSQLHECRPNLIVPLGNTACWALLDQTNIGTIRGTVTASPFGKCLPTYHPAAVLKQWSLRPLVLADLMKALCESRFPEIRRPRRSILVNPSLAELAQAADQLLAASGPMAIDTETRAGQITCISFATTPDFALVVPFVLPDLQSYWPLAEDEFVAWQQVQRLLASPQAKVFQNGVYDLQYIRKMRLRCTNVLEDTMLLHHSLYPELQKGLGFLGSIYTSEPAWKLMRRKRPDTEKRDE